ncbi:hypothetical protein A3860_39085 [Niastella vici]|uniref:Uncharacterized protein n=1 Tax=Niastella vici TaxID=1703345 RepID=A0A1V9FKT8_9BACT|nr:hypothetical protein [Niastella vici]OQP58940.1 hypothetical protein A3860_39085 [Niastella vici]
MIKIFEYHQELDCFVVNPVYKKIADSLGLTEWNEVVWIGRFFSMDNDFGEHWFDNWGLRTPLESKAEELGLDTTELFILDPDRFKNDHDGPCHSPEERISFWKDVLMSLHLSHETLFREARKLNQERMQYDPEDYIPDLEERIILITNNMT